jgi:hypothetical protein
MRAVRSWNLAWALLAACATPPRVDDRSTPTGAYETFRGALARGETEREYACFSPELARRLGIRSRQEWADLRTLALDSRHVVVRGISRSRIEGVKSRGMDTAEAELRFPLGIEGSVSLRRLPVVRVWTDAGESPRVYEILDRLLVRVEAEGLVVPLPPDLLPACEAELRRGRVIRAEALLEWFIDDFHVGGATPESVARQGNDPSTETRP